jgi:isoamylase
MTHFNWKPTEEQEAFHRFYAAACNFRRECPLLGREEFLTPEDITWHEGDWDNDTSKFMAFTLRGRCSPAISCEHRDKACASAVISVHSKC